MEPTDKRVLTLDEACEYTGYAKSYFYKLTSTGVLPFSKPNGKKIFFDKDQLDAWLMSNGTPALKENNQEVTHG